MTTPLTSRIIEITEPCSDNGKKFVETRRLDTIRRLLALSAYTCLADLPLAKIYSHSGFDRAKPAVLISCHIDSVYEAYHAALIGSELHGTFDNSACNAVAIECMLHNHLPAQSLVAFTGDEEDESRGADQTVEFLHQQRMLKRLEIAIALDLTEEAYGQCCTVENVFRRKRNRPSSLLRFESKKAFVAHLVNLIGPIPVIVDAEADESWQYDEYDLNCFSLCLPCRVLGSDMHESEGVAIRAQSADGYMRTLQRLMEAIDRDLAARGML